MEAQHNGRIWEVALVEGLLARSRGSFGCVAHVGIGIGMEWNAAA